MATSASENESAGEVVEVVQFLLDGNHYAVRVDETDSIIKPKETTRVPRSADAVDGVMDHRGEVAVVIDLYEVLDLERPEDVSDVKKAKERVLILDDSMDNQTVGLLAENVVGVQSYPDDELQTEFESSQTDVVEQGLIKGAFVLTRNNEEESDADETDVSDIETLVIELIDVEEVLRRIREESRLDFQQTK